MALIPHARIGADVIVELDVTLSTITGVSVTNKSARKVLIELTNAVGLKQSVNTAAGTVNAALTTLGTSLSNVAGLQINTRLD